MRKLLNNSINEMKNSFSIDWEAFSNYDERLISNPTKEFALCW